MEPTINCCGVDPLSASCFPAAMQPNQSPQQHSTDRFICQQSICYTGTNAFQIIEGD
jgi:hypothetical protein